MKFSAVILSAAVALAGLASPATAEESDVWVTTSVNIALLTTPGLSATGIDVDTVDGLVTLHGDVATESQKRTAAEVAERVEGVKSVQNLLQVVTPTRAHLVEVSDEHLEEQVQKKLEGLDVADGTHIEVESVTAGAVLLSGRAAELSDVLAAIEAAFAVPGVQRVASEIETPMPAPVS